MEKITIETIRKYVQKLREGGTSTDVVERKMRSVDKFVEWAHKQNIINASVYQQIRIEIDNVLSSKLQFKIQKLISLPKEALNKISKFQFPISKPVASHQQPLSNFGIQHYIGFGILFIFMALLGAGLYNRFFQKQERTFAYPTSLTRAGRLLSFQGRLTDSLGNPITAATNVAYKLYSVSTGGTALYTAGACSTTPDTDGIFSVLIGGSGYSPAPPQSVCGTEVPATIFSENANIYMGVTVGADAEMTPRQQIANVGYAINAETLQGFPPGSTINSIPFISNSGDVFLAAATPSLRSTYTSATFTLSSANATTIQSAGAGDIVLQATESGTLKFRTGGTGDANTRIFVANAGNVGIGTTGPAQKLDVGGNFVVKSTGEVGIGTTNPSYQFEVKGANAGIFLDRTGGEGFILVSQDGASGGQIRSFSGGQGLRFTDRSSGTEYMRITNGNVGIGTVSPAGLLHVAATAPFVVTTAGQVGIGTTSPSSLLDVNGTAWLRGTGTSGLYVTSSGNVGIGTTAPSSKLQVAGNIIPSATSTYDLGSSSLVWNNLYVNNVIGGGSGTSGFWTQQNALLYPANSTVDLAIGGTATTSAKFAFINVNSGNPTATISGNLALAVPTGSTPGTALNILNGGTFNLLTSVGGDAGLLSRLFVANGGNVGVGTTNPLQKLHIEGQCVAAGTLISVRRRKKRRSRNKFGMTGGDDDEWEELLVPIEDVLPGDEVLSLNEAAGAFEWQEVEKVMNMGVQETFALTTSSNKKIVTTANHPYLAIDKPTITQGTFEVDQSIRIEELGKPTIIGIALGNMQFTAKLLPETKKEILRTYQKVNKPGIFAVHTFAYAVAQTFKAADIYPARIIIDTEYSGFDRPIRDIIKLYLPDTNVLFGQIGKHSPAHTACWEVNRGKKKEHSVLTTDSLKMKKDRGHKALRTLSPRSDYLGSNRPHGPLSRKVYFTARDLSRAKWKKVSTLSKGQYIATLDGFEKITGIQKIKKLQTYDLQIARTHNFVGNGIVAHNTYISGNVGIGTTSPAGLLHVAATAPFVVTTAGQVGIGTTGPAGALHVVGNCVTAEALLKRKRRRKKADGTEEEYPEGDPSDPYGAGWEDVPIKDIEEGDEIMTLDEKTGKFVTQKVRKLMQMGKKEIYKITTESGKSIRTTAEHPYLTIADQKQTFAFIDEVGVGKAPDQPIFGVAALYTSDSLALNRKLHDIFTGAVSAYNTNKSRFEFKFNAVTRDNLRFFKAIIQTLAQDTSWFFAASLTKKKKGWNYWGAYLSLLQKLITKAPFTKLTVVADYLAKPEMSKKDLETITQLDKVAQLLQLESQGSLLLQVADILLGALHFEERQKELGITGGKEAKMKLAKMVKDLLAKKITAIEWLHAVKDTLTQSIPAVKRQKWVKVKDLAKGALIATTDGWERIVRIEKQKPEEVYDIEIENTHNFVANEIVAHNTYIMSGNVGIGTTGPGQKLSVASGMIGVSDGTNTLKLGGWGTTVDATRITGTGSQIDFLTDGGAAQVIRTGGLYVSSSYGGLPPSNGAYIQGNVGIGTTAPSSKLQVAGNITPSATSTYDLGSSSLVWNNLYVNNIIGGGSGTSGFWTQQSGLLYPGNATVDLAIGGTATTSAKFAFINVNSGNPTATISGNLALAVPTGSTPGTALNILNGGSFNLLTSVGGDAGLLSRLFVANGGNVGVGTTNPLQKLHVEGQCVAAGTLIRRRRKKLKVKSSKFKVGGGPDPNPDDEWEDIPVEDIEPDDEVLSLNEATGEFEWQLVEKTMDMGNQETFALTTSSNKKILTTANHPYLTIDKPTITQGTFEVDQSIRIEELGKPTIIGIALGNMQFTAKLLPETKKEILRTYQKANKPALFAVHTFAYAVAQTFKAADIYPARIIIDTEYSGFDRPIRDIIKLYLPDTNVLFGQIGKHSPAHTACWEVNRGKKKENTVLTIDSLKMKKDRGHKALRTLSPRSDYLGSNRPHGPLSQREYFTARDLSRAKWKKVSTLSKGQYIATLDGFEKITGIQKVKKLQTYDLQIARTHNFVGNGIVAHNTYIRGAGTGTGFSLRTADNTGADKFVVLDSGNVGIGTTGPGYGLDISASASNGGVTRFLRSADNVSILVGGNTTGTAAIHGFGAATTKLGLGVSTDFSSASNVVNIMSGGVGIGYADPGTAKLAINGNVGIGTTSPSSLLDVNGTAWLRGTGTSGLYVTSSGNVGIGTTAPSGKLDVAGNLVVSAAGTTTFNGIAYTWPGSQSSSYFLQTNGSGTLSWADVNTAAAGSIYWNQANGLIYPKNATVDLAIGGTATTSAKFAFINVNSGNPTATISGNLAISSPTGANPATTYDVLNGGTYNLRTSVGGDAGLSSRLFVNNAGNVGIGTTSPGQQLEVFTGSTLKGLRINRYSSGVYYSDIIHTDSPEGLAFKVGDGSTITEKMRITGAGNVGIGTTAPTQKLDVLGSATVSANLTSGGQVQLGRFASSPTAIGVGSLYYDTTQNKVYYYNGSTWSEVGAGGSSSWSSLTAPTANLSLAMGTYTTAFNWATGTGTNNLFSLTTDASANGTGSLLNIQTGASSTVNPLRVRAGSTEGLFVNSSGNVGIGTTGPSNKLDVNGIVAGTYFVDYSNNAYGLDPTGTSNFGGYSQKITGGALLALDSGGVAIGGYGSPGTAALAVNGNVGIGTTGPSQALDIGGSAANITFSHATGPHQILTAGSSNLALMPGGNVGVGTTAPSTKLDVNGTITTQTGLVNSNVSDSSTAVAFLLASNNTLSTQGSKLLSVKNASTEKFYIDSSGNVYAAGTILSGNGSGILMTNKSGGTVAQKALVITDSSNNSSFTTTTTPYSKAVYGVVTGVGLGVANDADGDGACDANDNCMIAYGGEVNVTVKNTTTVTKGDYVYTSDTAGSAVTSAKMFDGVIGIVTNTSTSGSGYVKIVFKPQIQVTAAASIDKGTKHNEYRILGYGYTTVGEGTSPNQNIPPRGLYYDNLSDGTKTDAANTTVSGPVQFQSPLFNLSSSILNPPTSPYRVGLIGGQTMSTATTDNAGNTYLGSNTVNKVFYYDRTRDSSPQTQVELGIDPNWYNGVTLAVATTSATFSQNSTVPGQPRNPNLSVTYNGSLVKVTGTYSTQAATRTIFITIKSPSTFSWNDYNGNSGSNVTITPGQAQTLGSTGVSVTFTQTTKYNTGDVFKIASWFVEPSSSTRGAKQQFPERAYLAATISSVDIIDADTQKLWMRFSQGTNYSLGADANNNPSSVSVLNGKMYVPTNGSSATGLYEMDFGTDAIYRQDATNWSLSNKPIALRDTANNYSAINTSNILVNATANDVSASVIPNQPTQNVTVSGWGYVTGNGVNTYAIETVNLPYKFNDIPRVSLVYAGNAASAPTKLSDCSGWNEYASFDASAITQTSFSSNAFSTNTTTALTNNRNFCYTWTATGQVSPRQFVGVATNGGITILNETDATGTNPTTTGSSTAVVLTSNGSMYGAVNAANPWVSAYHLAANASTGNDRYNDWYTDHNGTFSGYTVNRYPGNTSTINTITVTEGTSTVQSGRNTIYISTNSGIAAIQEYWDNGYAETFTRALGSSKYYTKDYVSEEMVGDIRGMWPLSANGAISMSDASVKGNTLTNNGTATFVTGVRGGGVSLNGSTQYLSCTDAACGGTSKLDLTGNFTLGIWLKTNNVSASQYIFAKTTQAGGGPGYGLYLQSNTLYLATNASNTSWSSAIPDTNWHFVVVTYDGSSAKYYRDGTLVGSNAYSTNAPDSNSDFIIGRDTNSASMYFPGTIDEPFVTATALTAGQVKHMYEVGYRALQSHATTLGGGAADSNQQLGYISTGTNTVGAVGVDYNNQYMYVGLNSTTLGGLSKIDLNSDTNIKTYNASANVPAGGTLLIDEDVKSVAVGYNLEAVSSAASGVKTMGADNYATATSGNFISKTVTTAESFSQAYLWAQYVLDSSDTSNTVQVWASNDGGSNYYQCNLTNTDTSQTPSEYEYFCQFNAIGSSLKTKFVFARGSTKTNTYVTRYGIAWIGSDAIGGAPGGNGLYTNNNSSVANGSYIDVAHNQNTNDVLTEGWIYDGAKWVQIDDHAGTDHNTEDPKLLSWYKMEETSGTLDNAQGTAARDLISKNGPTYQATGRVNKAITFDGTNDYFCTGSGTTCADTDTLDFAAADSFTLGGWFKHDTITTNPDYIMSKRAASLFSVDTNNTLGTSLNGYWKLEESSGNRVDSAGENDLTSTNSVGQATGKVNYAAQFNNASNRYLSISDNASISTGDIDYSWAGWIYADTLNLEREILMKINSDDSGREYRLMVDTNNGTKAQFVVYGTDGSTVIGNVSATTFGALSATTWYFIYAYHDATNNQVGISVNNGTIDTAATTGAAGDQNSPLYVGVRSSNPATAWDGRIDELGFWKKVLTAQERTDLYNSGNGNTCTDDCNGGELGYKLYMESDGDLTFGIDDDGASFPEDSATTALATYDDNTWHHVAAVKNGTTNIKLYIDGQEVASDTSLSTTGTLANNGPFYLGIDSDATSNPWQGSLDEMFAYSRALTAGEIAELYRSSKRYYIQQVDANTVRLYNYSGSSQNLRLDVITGGLGRNAGTVSLAPAAADVNAQDNTNAIWINQTGVNGALLKLQRGGTDIFNLSQRGGDAAVILDQRLSGDLFTASVSGITKFVIDNSGEIGIGVTAPKAQLEISSSNLDTLNATSSSTVKNAVVAKFRQTGTPAGGLASSSFTDNDDTEFTGQKNRVVDEDTGSTTKLITAYKELPADINTLALYHFNNGVCATDSSGNSYTLTANGGMTCSSGGKFDYKASGFAATPVSYSHATILDRAMTSGTIEAWINPANLSATQTIIYADSTNDTYITLGTSGQITFSTSASTALSTGNSLVSTSTWTHVAVVWNSAGHKIYINGVEQASDSNTTTHSSQDYTTYIGVGAGGNTNPFSGSIDEMRISLFDRSPEEIKQDAQRRPYAIYTSDVKDLGTNISSFTNLQWSEAGVTTGDGETVFSSTNLVAQWNLNETSGTTAASGGSCGATCNGTLTNFASTGSQDAAAGTGWTANNKRWGAGALMFDGSNDYISIANNTISGVTNQISVSAWFKENNYPSGSNYQGLITKANAWATDMSFVLDLTRDGGLNNTIRFTMSTTGSNTVSVNQQDVTFGEWHYVVGTYDGSTVKLYLDGKQVGNTASITGNVYQSSVATIMGGIYTGDNGWSEFNGVIDTTQIYSRTLTASEILANYQAGNIEFQTRTSADNSTWEAWKPTASEAALDAVDSLSPVEKISQTNLVAYWKLDETSGTRADSKGSNNLTDNNTVTYAPGRLGNAGHFKSANSEYLSIVDNTDLSTGDIDFSLSAWVQAESLGNRVVIAKWNSLTPQREYYLWYSNTNSRFEFGVRDSGDTTNTAVNATNFGAASTATWYFLYAYHDSLANEIGISVNNGAVNTTPTSSGVRDGTAAFTIGVQADPTNYWDGLIDEVAFWKRTLTAAERTRLYEDGLDLHGAGSGRIYRTRDTATKIEGTASEKLTLGAPQVDANTVALWHLEETSGTGAYIKDSTANANHGTPTGTTVVDGFFGKARRFNGTSDVIRASVNASMEYNNSFTFEAWINPATLSAQDDYGMIIVNRRSYCQLFGLGDETGGQGKLVFYGCGLSSPGYHASTGTVSINTWSHVAVVYDGSAVTFYINGQPSGSVSTSGSFSVSSESGIDIGMDPSQGTTYDRPFNGQIDEVRISNIARSAEEIAEAYRAGRDHRVGRTISSTNLSSKTKLPFYVAADRPGTYLEATVGESAFANYEPDANTVGLWHLEETSGSNAFLKDSSGNGNRLTVASTPSSLQGKIGKARYSDNTVNKYLCSDSDNNGICDTNSNLHATSNFTIDAWVKPAAITGPNGLDIARDWDSNNGYEFYIKTDGTVNLYANTANVCATTTALSANNWYHVALTISSTTSAKIFINGQESVSCTISAINNGTIFKSLISTGSGTGVYGTIDELRLSNTTRTADEIRQAYEVGRRTHPITIDFAAKGDGGNLIANSTDYSFTVDATAHGAQNKGDNLFVGDKVIVRENVGGTEYIAQGDVTAVTASSGAVTVSSWDSGGTFPSGGYTANATFFKWQREMFDPTGSLTTQRDAVTRITLRVTDGSEGRTFWLDDFKSGGAYLTTPGGSTVSSTAQRYFQYRTIYSSTDPAVSSDVTSVTLNYTTGETTTNYSLYISNSGGATNNIGGYFSASGGTNNYGLIVENGYVGIGTASPAEKLHIASGNVRIGAGSLCVKSTNAACAGSTVGTIYATNTTVQSADVAENYVTSDGSIEAGDVVAISQNNTSDGVEKSKKAYDPSMLGIISTKPGVTLGSDTATDSAHPYLVPVSLSGRVPVKIAPDSAPIEVGDFLTSSGTYPGMAMKATKAGYTVAKALESWAPGGPELVEGFVHLGYNDPDVMLTSTGDLVIARQSQNEIATPTTDVGARDDNNATNSAEFVYDGNLEEITDERWKIEDSAGAIIERVGAFSDAAIANLRTGLIQAENITTKQFSALSSSIYHLSSKLIVSEKIVSPVIETTSLTSQTAQISQITTNEIKPQNGDLTINLDRGSKMDDGSDSTGLQSSIYPLPSNDKGPLARLIIRGLEGKTAVVIDAEGNATFSGTLTAQNVSASSSAFLSSSIFNLSSHNASISGTLAASEASLSGKLIAKEIESENITKLESELTSLSNQTNLTNETYSQNINDIQRFLADIKNNPLPDPQYYQNLDQGSKIEDESNSSTLPSSIHHLLSNSLTISGQSNLYNVSVTGSLLTGSLLIENNSILSLASDLKLSALEKITLFDGAVTIAKNGTITTTGEVIAQGGVRTDQIKPISKDLSIQLDTLDQSDQSNGKLVIQNQLGDTVASIDASGSAYFRQLSLDTYLDATRSAAVIAAPDNFEKNGLYTPAIETTTQSAGVGYLPANQSEVVIYNQNITDRSLIYVTPTSPSPTGNLTVTKKEVGAKPYFKVAIAQPASYPVQFNWFIIN